MGGGTSARGLERRHGEWTGSTERSARVVAGHACAHEDGRLERHAQDLGRRRLRHPALRLDAAEEVVARASAHAAGATGALASRREGNARGAQVGDASALVAAREPMQAAVDHERHVRWEGERG